MTRRLLLTFAFPVALVFSALVWETRGLRAEPEADSKATTSPKPAASSRPPSLEPKPGDPPRELFSGKVVMLRDALKAKGVTATEEFDKQVVLESENGELIPIVPDWRGRAFYQDEKLRNRKVDLVGYRRPGIPYLQVLMVFTFDEKGTRQYTDYWCDICSIPMYEVKECDCCRAPIHLRFQARPLPSYIKPK
ncbi:MAG: hypothetical protein AB7O26_02985 [Planctomycetaceae bacterium]